ncbi:leucyl/phenylalanyl-tRNA--protein transferase [Gammaproteobacteria bacterium ESL0073]|uniref:Leucyl/phenylalanyl-tRNA--protein transferase n=1 Tax=Entomomonas moraniae TaxID=2213226 RepID=A0A3Q9JN48_9GAMM|nr:leucyl/phenylalanyl-tRNA--protein transferase [Entomomonas moraniae]AWM80392.1 leucyl/phenylalanyl-tRNA--protein transferase [Gammaproteobacteria bacterium ESL0073]AZS50342.1 leucyl/phenylalanyl-tRNA--protein transferase [Entomomonas moraniae]
MSLTLLSDEDLTFPPLEQALTEPDGLLAMGGDLSPTRLEAAYRHGCFPWFNPEDPILWWSPDPRMVLFPDQLHVSRSMRRLLNASTFDVTYDQEFSAVIEGCSQPRDYTDLTWITDDMRQAYLTLHELGLAHSVEIWQQGELVGGLYGLLIGRLFFGESMFSRVTNASKFGFIQLVYKLRKAGVVLIDCQMHTSHLQSLGADLIPRKVFASYLRDYQYQSISIDWKYSDGMVG